MIDNTQYINAFNAVSFLLGGVLGWILKNLRIKAEIEKLKLESTSKKMDFLDKIQEKRKQFNSDKENLCLIFDECVEAMASKDTLKAIGCRKTMNHFFFHSYWNSFFEYFETKITVKNNIKDKMLIIEDEVLPFLETCQKFLEVTNSNIFVMHLEQNKLAIQYQSIKYLYKFCLYNIKFFNLKLRKKVKTLKNEIVSE
jgi:hypothetical protein